MKAAELREIVGRMTERPWERLDGIDPPADADGILVLANHASAIVELVAAEESRRAARCTDAAPFALDGCVGMNHTAHCDLGKAERAVDAALDRVHAIGATDG